MSLDGCHNCQDFYIFQNSPIFQIFPSSELLFYNVKRLLVEKCPILFIDSHLLTLMYNNFPLFIYLLLI